MNNAVLEGGNVFKGPNKEPLTQRIATGDIAETIVWLEKATGLDFTAEKGEDKLPVKWLGTTGRKTDADGTFERNSSGDLDLSIDANEVNKDEFFNKLVAQFGKENVKKSGDSVHLKTPIKGDPANGFVQSDFMFSSNPKFQQGSMLGGTGEYRGEHRHILLSSIARARGLKYSPKFGLVDPETNEPLPQGDDWNVIAKKLLGQTASTKDIRSVEGILNYIEKLPNYEELVAAARETLGKQGVKLPEQITFESAQTGTPQWFRRMMGRIR